jgi:hypothetical protein
MSRKNASDWRTNIMNLFITDQFARRSSASSFCTLLMKMRSLMFATIVA